MREFNGYAYSLSVMLMSVRENNPNRKFDIVLIDQSSPARDDIVPHQLALIRSLADRVITAPGQLPSPADVRTCASKHKGDNTAMQKCFIAAGSDPPLVETGPRDWKHCSWVYWTKMWALLLVEYERVLWLGADTLVFGSLEPVVGCEPPCGAQDGWLRPDTAQPWWAGPPINGDIIVLKTSPRDYAAMMACHREERFGDASIGPCDMPLLNMFYRGHWTVLPTVYGVQLTPVGDAFTAVPERAPNDTRCSCSKMGGTAAMHGLCADPKVLGQYLQVGTAPSDWRIVHFAMQEMKPHHLCNADDPAVLEWYRANPWMLKELPQFKARHAPFCEAHRRVGERLRTYAATAVPGVTVDTRRSLLGGAAP